MDNLRYQTNSRRVHSLYLKSTEPLQNFDRLFDSSLWEIRLECYIKTDFHTSNDDNTLTKQIVQSLQWYSTFVNTVRLQAPSVTISPFFIIYSSTIMESAALLFTRRFDVINTGQYTVQTMTNFTLIDEPHSQYRHGQDSTEY